MKIKFKRLSKRFYIIIIIVCMLLMIFFIKGKIKYNFVSHIFSSLQKNISEKIFYIKDSLTASKYIKDSGKLINDLNKRYIYLINENQILKAENEKLKRLLKLTDDNKSKKFIKCYANVIGANIDGLIFSYLIDKGEKDDIKVGDGVVSKDGVVGVIQKVFPDTSVVLLLTDVKCKISVRIERNKITGVLTGAGYNLCELEYIPKEENVIIGDLVITSGLSYSFPAGLLVGRIISVEKKNDKLTMDIKVKPFVNVADIQEVYIVSGYLK
ncbi:MAG: rod shape-determining protein MreC [Candidatus Goldbacteria bacterium]|nr:rod shape-determining protein MreC [Candidatus Goldiibacteriota bacterium]